MSIEKEKAGETAAAVKGKETSRKVLLRLRSISKYFPIKKKSIFQKDKKYVRANENISLDIYEGETLGLVGESGCGKSTLGRTLLNLYPHSEGYVTYGGRNIYDFQPAYVRRILENLPEEVEKWKKLSQEEGEKIKKWEGLSEEDQMKGRPLLMEETRKSREAYYVLTQLLGGLLACPDMDKVRKVMLAQYECGVRLAGQGVDLYDLLEGLASGERKEEEIPDSDTDLRAFARAWREVEDVRDGCRGLEGFGEYEGNREIGLNLYQLTKEEMRSLRKDLQIIFQDPYSSLDARMTIGQIIGEGLLTHNFFDKNGEEMQQYIMKVMEECGLAPYFFHRYPHQFSGGQRQRVGIARSLALKPRFIVCDEAVSALDVSIQSQIINLLQELKDKEQLTYLFISHNLSVVKYISDRICVMYLGNVVEMADTESLFAHPMHPYTAALLSAIPSDSEETQAAIQILEGDIPSPVNPPRGCKFHTRCKYCRDLCRHSAPELTEIEPGHYVACHLTSGKIE